MSYPTVDTACPELPSEIFDVPMNENCRILWEEVLEEVMDHDYLRRSHHNVGTYDKGCRGPLCRKALREHPKRKTPNGHAVTLREARIYDPVLEYFHIVIKHRIREVRRQILQDLRENVIR